EKILELLFGLLMLNWNGATTKRNEYSSAAEAFPGAGYALAKLCFAQLGDDWKTVPLVPGIHKRMASGDSKQSMELAVRRLRASGCRVPEYSGLTIPGDLSRRVAAALVFPLDEVGVRIIQKRTFKEKEKEDGGVEE
ncbi:MAG TPA: hypothetical protein VI874_04810, partial [Candidatus Norongarragalinales archaeon]|nr:hypothetical protein [Candidatus Norongarragalinales archaeon]